ncbi:3'-5' exonuclease [Streptomyces solisilvae]|uniref:3'-5' exonuclease n=1 Tax=Streptomyces malaysiensis TaxID=92644 RepID=UPI0033208253
MTQARGHLSEDEDFRAARFWVIDFKGTTPRGHRPEPIEVGILALQHRPVVGPLPTGYTFHSFIRPPEHAPLTAMDTARTRIRAQDLADASSASVVLGTLESHVPTEPVLLVAHHAPINADFLHAYRDACPRLARTTLIDTMLLARALHPGLNSYQLDALASHLHLLPATRRPQAKDDLKITARLFRQLLGDAARRGLFASLTDLIHATGHPPKASQPRHPGLF